MKLVGPTTTGSSLSSMALGEFIPIPNSKPCSNLVPDMQWTLSYCYFRASSLHKLATSSRLRTPMLSPSLCTWECCSVLSSGVSQPTSLEDVSRSMSHYSSAQSSQLWLELLPTGLLYAYSLHFSALAVVVI